MKVLAELCPQDLNVISDSYFYDQTPLSLAIKARDTEIMWILVEAGADPDKKVNLDFRVGTHLTYAVGLGEREIVQILLNAGADPNKSARSSGLSPLDIAIEKGYTEIVRILTGTSN